MKKILLLSFLLSSTFQIFSQIEFLNNKLTNSDKIFIKNKSKNLKKGLSSRGSTTSIMLNYPTVDSVLQFKALTGTITESSFYWEMRNSTIDTNNLGTAANGFNTKGLIQGYSDLTYLDNMYNVLLIDRTKATITIDSINPFFAQFTKGGAGNDTIIFDVFEDSTRLGVNQSCNFDLKIGGGLLVASDTLVVVTAADIDTYMFRKKVTLAKGAGFMFRVRMYGDINSKFRCYATYSENCSDSAFARQSRVGYSYYSSVYKPTTGSPYRLSLWNSNDLNTTIACKKMYTQNWLIYPFISVAVDSPSVIVSNNQTNTMRCQGNQVQLIASPQGYTSTSLTYTWAPATGLSATNIANPIATVGTLASTTYSVTVTDGTTPIVGTTIIVASQPTATMTASKTVLSSCIDSVKLTATATSGPIAYSWSNGSSTAINYVKATGTYTVTASNGFGCTATATSPAITSTVPAPPVLDFTFTPTTSANTVCQDKDINFKTTATATRANWVYTWKDGATAFANSGTDVSYIFTTAGSKTVYLNADSGACKAVQVSKTISVLPKTDAKCKSSIADAISENIKVYPNPVRNGEVFIQNDMNQVLTFKITDMLGKVISTDRVSGNKTNPIDLTNAPNGIYFIEMESKGDKAIQKIVVEKH